MIRTILVPLDGFPFGEHAIPMALGIARHVGATVKLLHVLQPFTDVVPELAVYQGPLEAECRQEKKAYLDSVIRRIREVSEVKVSAKLVEGEVAVGILDAVSGDKADLVVMTTHGRGPLARFWLGSSADQMVRESPVPVLLVHPGSESPDFHREPALEHVLLTLDGTPLAEQVIPSTVELAKAMNAEVILLRVIRTDLPPDFGAEYRTGYVPAHARELVEQLEAIQDRQKEEAESYLKTVADRIRESGVAVTTKVILDEAPDAAVLHEAEEGVDLVALETHGHGGLKRLWRGSMADKVIRGSSVPVLVQHPRA